MSLPVLASVTKRDIHSCRWFALWTNAGFLLSFGCVLGIILIYPVLIKQLEKERDREKEKQFSWKLKQKMKEGVCAGFSILLMTLPIQLSFYYEYPLISLLWNSFSENTSTQTAAQARSGIFLPPWKRDAAASYPKGWR